MPKSWVYPSLSILLLQMESLYSKSEVRVVEILANNLPVKEQSMTNLRKGVCRFRGVGEER